MNHSSFTVPSDPPPEDPQYPSHLLLPTMDEELPSYRAAEHSQSPPTSMNPSVGAPTGWGFPQQAPSAFVVPPEVDPPIDATGLDRKTASRIQQELAKWLRDSRYSISPSEGSSFLKPCHSFVLGVVGGTIAGKLMLTRFFPMLAQPPRSRAWLLGTILGGYPLGLIGLYVTQLPAAKALLEQKGPLGIQARYIYRALQAEKNGVPPPSPPFPSHPILQTGMARHWGSPTGVPSTPQDQSSALPQQMVQWNSFQPQPQYPLPMPSNIQHWGQTSSTPSNEPRFRSWDDIRKTNQADLNTSKNVSTPTSETQY